MNEAEHRRLLTELARVLDQQDWDRMPDVVAADAVMEFPQSGEVFRGRDNITAQFADYPDLEAGNTELAEVIGGSRYALTLMYTVVAVEGSGDRGALTIRVRYPDGSHWWVVNLYEVADGRVTRIKAFFAPEFEAPDWRAPYRDG